MEREFLYALFNLLDNNLSEQKFDFIPASEFTFLSLNNPAADPVKLSKLTYFLENLTFLKIKEGK